MRARSAGILFSIAIVLFFNVAPTMAQLSERVGAVKEMIKIDQGISLVLENARITITAYSSQIIRIRCVKGEYGKDVSYAVIGAPRLTTVQIAEFAGNIEFSTDSLRVIISKNPFRLQYYNKGGKPLDEDDSTLGISWQGTEVSCYKKMYSDQRFIGLGEKTGSLDRRGRSFVHWNTDHYAYGVEDDPLYTSVPFFIGLHDRAAYGILFDNTYRTTFDFGASSDNSTYSFSAVDGEMNYYFIGGSSVANIIESYTSLTGRMEMPPLWSLGYQQCRWSYYPDTDVLNLARTFREKKIPADVIYLDIHYMDAYKIFTWHPERFARPKEMIDSLKKMGFHVVTIVDPGIKIEDGYFAHDEGVKNDYFIKYPGGANYIGSVWPGRCNFPDFTDERVRLWWGKSFSHLTEPGVEGFWNDMNEPAVWGQSIPDVVQLQYDSKKTTMREAHNIYGMEMARSTFEGAKSLLNGHRPFVLTRAGFAGIQRYSAVWTGDNVPSDDHMMLAVRLVNSMGLSGIPFTGSDIGGFSGDPSHDLFSRWLSIGTYTPFFRNHKQNGMNRQEPWALGEQVEELSRKSIEDRYRLLPYLYSSFYETTQSGMPIARSLAIDYTFDEHIYWGQYQHEYLFGKFLLIAPVRSTERYADVYLPQGGWYRLSDDQYFEGNKSFLVDAPINNLPVFVRAGGIVPMQSVVQFTSQHPSDTLMLHVYFGKSQTTFSFYEDDGATYEYEKGNYAKRAVRFDPKKKEITFSKTEGNFTSKFPFVRLILHHFEGASKVSVDGTILSLAASKTNGETKETVFVNSRGNISVKW